MISSIFIHFPMDFPWISGWNKPAPAHSICHGGRSVAGDPGPGHRHGRSWHHPAFHDLQCGAEGGFSPMFTRDFRHFMSYELL